MVTHAVLQQESSEPVRYLHGDVREVLLTLEPQSVHVVITSPPYFGLRKYSDSPLELGLEETPQEYVDTLVDVFRGVWRVLRDDGLLFIVLGDSYASLWPCSRRNIVGQDGLVNGKREARAPRMGKGLKDKSLIGIPWRVALALQDDGWILRSDIIFAKKNCMPESVKDRPTRSHEYVFMLAKSQKYYYDADAVREPHTTVHPRHDWRTKDYRARGMPGELNGPGGYKKGAPAQAAGNHPVGRNKRSVWMVATAPFSGKKYGSDVEHYAAYPPALIRPMVRASTSERGVCRSCGAPWTRLIKQSRERDPSVGWNAMRGAGHFRASPGGPAMREGREWQRITESTTTGWQAGCACNAGEPVPATILDIFGGSGTSALVARQEGRHAILIDINAAYLDLARKRLAYELDPSSRPKPSKPRGPKNDDGLVQGYLFDPHHAPDAGLVQESFFDHCTEDITRDE